MLFLKGMGKRKAGKIKVTYADGTTETVKQGHFDKRRKGRSWYLRTDHWKMIRRKARERDGHKCVHCGADEKLEVHHKTYVRIGHERLEDLETLCQACHPRADDIRRAEQRKRELARAATLR